LAAVATAAISAIARAQDPSEPPTGKSATQTLPAATQVIARASVDEKALRATMEKLAACGT